MITRWCAATCLICANCKASARMKEVALIGQVTGLGRVQFAPSFRSRCCPTFPHHRRPLSPWQMPIINTVPLILLDLDPANLLLSFYLLYTVLTNMGTLTADCPRLDAHCDHKLATSCRLTSTPNCCACADERAHSLTYRVYIDGIGFVQRGTRWQGYCWFCKGSSSHLT